MAHITGQHSDGHREVLTDPNANYYNTGDLVQEALLEMTKKGFERVVYYDGAGKPIFTMLLGEQWKEGTE